MITSKLTDLQSPDDHTTSDQDSVALAASNEIAYEIQKDRSVYGTFMTFNEWDSDADRRAYAAL